MNHDARIFSRRGRRAGLALALLAFGSAYAFQFFDHYLKNAPAPRWMTEGVPFLDKDAKRDPGTKE